MKSWLTLLVLSLNAISASAADDLPAKLKQLKLPPGFKIEVLARIPGARAMAVSPQGTLYVTNKEDEQVHALTRKDLKTVKQQVVMRDLEKPLGVAFHNGDLYASGVFRIAKVAGIEKNLANPKMTVVTSALPKEGHHGGRFIAFGPDQKLYIGVGAPCNVCDKGPTYANIMRMNADGSGLEVFAEGIRNTVGFDFHPKTKELWFTDNGRDMMGDDIPGDEINRAPKARMHFGYPYCHADGVVDPEFGKGKDCASYVKPAQVLGAHVAALGMRFYTGKMFPPEYQGQIFVAEHGSWNRSRKSGYRVMLAKLEGDKVVSYSPFIEGFLNDEKAWGRPADVLVDQDGSLLVSDDEAGAVYRVTYAKPAS